MNEERLLRVRDVLTRIPVGRATLYKWMNKGAFPQPLKLGGGIVAWRQSDIDAWIESRPMKE